MRISKIASTGALRPNHRRRAHPDPTHDLTGADAIGSEQHDPDPLRQPRPQRRGPHPRRQHLTVSRWQFHSRGQLPLRRVESDLQLPRPVHLASGSPMDPQTTQPHEVGRPPTPLPTQVATHRGQRDVVPTQTVTVSRYRYRANNIATPWASRTPTPVASSKGMGSWRAGCVETRTSGSAGRLGKRNACKGVNVFRSGASGGRRLPAAVAADSAGAVGGGGREPGHTWQCRWRRGEHPVLDSAGVHRRPSGGCCRGVRAGAGHGRGARRGGLRPCSRGHGERADRQRLQRRRSVDRRRLLPRRRRGGHPSRAPPPPQQCLGRRPGRAADDRGESGGPRPSPSAGAAGGTDRHRHHGEGGEPARLVLGALGVRRRRRELADSPSYTWSAQRPPKSCRHHRVLAPSMGRCSPDWSAPARAAERCWPLSSSTGCCRFGRRSCPACSAPSCCVVDSRCSVRRPCRRRSPT
jgi:hypothetical protein